jgi:hypothetical protein
MPAMTRTTKAKSNRCATDLLGAEYTTSEAVYLPVRKVFSCPKFKVLDVGRAYPQGWPQRFGVVFKPHVHLADLNSRQMVFEFPEGIKTMTPFTTTTLATGNPGTLPTLVITKSSTALGRLLHTRMAQCVPLALAPAKVDPLARQQAIENALSMALHLVRTSDTPESLQRATGRAIRAASMLKQACTEINSRAATA